MRLVQHWLEGMSTYLWLLRWAKVPDSEWNHKMQEGETRSILPHEQSHVYEYHIFSEISKQTTSLFPILLFSKSLCIQWPGLFRDGCGAPEFGVIFRQWNQHYLYLKRFLGNEDLILILRMLVLFRPLEDAFSLFTPLWWTGYALQNLVGKSGWIEVESKVNWMRGRVKRLWRISTQSSTSAWENMAFHENHNGIVHVMVTISPMHIEFDHGLSKKDWLLSE